MTDHDPLNELRSALAGMTDAELRQAILTSDTPERQEALARRLAPYRTPVTEATTRRGPSSLDEARAVALMRRHRDPDPDSDDVHPLTNGHWNGDGWTLSDAAHERVAKQMVMIADGRAVLRDAAKMLARVRDAGDDADSPGRVVGRLHSMSGDINGMIDRCNLASMGVVQQHEPTTLESASGGDLLRRPRPPGESSIVLRDAAKMLQRLRGLAMSPDTAVDINEMIDRCNLASMGVKGPAWESGDSFAAVQAALGQMRRVAGIGDWARLVGGTQQLCGAELRALAELLDGKVAPAQIVSSLGPREVLAGEGWRDMGNGTWSHDGSGATVVFEDGEARTRGLTFVTAGVLEAFAELARESR